MPALIQYAFNNENQWENAGEPKLIEANAEIVELGQDREGGKYHVEVLFYDTDDIPENGLLNSKSITPVPHEFIGYETLEQYEIRKGIRPDPNQV